MTDIKLIDNRIIFDGHANTVQECNTITNVVNVLSESSDFSKIKVESGYAEFECTKELPYGHMIFVPTFDTAIYSNDGTILYGSDGWYDQSFSMTINSNNLTGEFQESQNGATVSGGTLFLPFNIIGLTQTIGKQTPDDGMFVGDTIADSAPDTTIVYKYYVVTAPTSTDTKPVYKRVDGEWIKQTAFEMVSGAWTQISTYEAPEPPAANYLTFSSPGSFSISKTGNNNGTLEYSTNTTTWTNWTGSTINSVNNVIYIRGSNNTYIKGDASNFRPFFNMTGSNISCTGNIENLLDYQTVALGNHPTMSTYCYQSMFYGCTSLTTAPELPATTLETGCYSYMFYNCTSLTTAPELPATTLANFCYQYMFYGCTALKVSATQTGTYQYAWRIPTSGTGTTASYWNRYMLNGTGGTFTSNPTINTTYFVEYEPV